MNPFKEKCSLNNSVGCDKKIMTWDAADKVNSHHFGCKEWLMRVWNEDESVEFLGDFIFIFALTTYLR